jgi:hypothetical protein
MKYGRKTGDELDSVGREYEEEVRLCRQKKMNII